MVAESEEDSVLDMEPVSSDDTLVDEDGLEFVSEDSVVGIVIVEESVALGFETGPVTDPESSVGSVMVVVMVEMGPSDVDCGSSEEVVVALEGGLTSSAGTAPSWAGWQPGGNIPSKATSIVESEAHMMALPPTKASLNHSMPFSKVTKNRVKILDALLILGVSGVTAKT
jgi:hypothetical protein